MRIGVAGLGVMGAAVAARLMEVGHQVTVWNRTPEKTKPLADAGAKVAIVDRKLDRRNFRRKILALGLLKSLPKTRRGAHRPATLYTFTRRSPMNVEVL
jgi:3-hydroxyacyl-CoA dehydrogenase